MKFEKHGYQVQRGAQVELSHLSSIYNSGAGIQSKSLSGAKLITELIKAKKISKRERIKGKKIKLDNIEKHNTF